MSVGREGTFREPTAASWAMVTVFSSLEFEETIHMGVGDHCVGSARVGEEPSCYHELRSHWLVVGAVGSQQFLLSSR